MRDKYIVVVGNVADGFTFIGPFNTFDKALAYAEHDLGGDDEWYVCGIESPGGQES
jgi:hypothetical protein